MTTGRPLLQVDHLTVDYGRGRHRVRAVADVSFGVSNGETVGLVGESGSGKSTIAKALVGLANASGGSITFDGEDITRTTTSRRRELASAIQIVFQDPYGSLNPAKTIGQTLAEPFLISPRTSRATRRDQIAQMVERVGLDLEILAKHPAHLSGGQRQRVAIARALMLGPKLVVCDEPVSSLDLSVQAQILNLLADLQAELAMSYLFIAHNLTVVRHLANQVIVLYRGQVAEYGSAELIYRRPAHPYTQALLASEPAPDPIVQRKRQGLDASSVAAQTTPAAVGSRTEGCVFADRCPLAIDPCRNDRPPLTKIPDGRSVACIRYPDTAGNGADVVTRSAVP